MKSWIIGMGVVCLSGMMVAQAEDRPARSNAVVATDRASVSVLPVDTKATDTNAAEKINSEIQTLLQEETSLRGESRTLAMQLQNFASEMGTNNTTVSKFYRDWRAAQDNADRLRAVMQAEIEKTPQFTDLKARRDTVDARLLQIRTRLRELMKDRALQGRVRSGGIPTGQPSTTRLPPAGAVPPVKSK